MVEYAQAGSVHPQPRRIYEVPGAGARRFSGQRTVLVTGVAGQWGSRVARRLLADPGLRVLGIDRTAPDRVDQGLDFVRADVRNPLLTELLSAEEVDTVVHLAFRERQWRREPDFESNVLGTMLLLGACAEAGVRRVVLKSYMAVYGADLESSMYVSEDWPLRARSTYAYVRDAVDIERFVQEFRPEYPELQIVLLRFPHIVGFEVMTPFTRLLRLPVLPSLLGFDPVMQVIDARDVVSALVHGAMVDADGAFNVAAKGAVSLLQVAGVLGRPVLPVVHLAVYWSWGMLASTPATRRLLEWFPIDPDYLRYPCTGDLSRMRDELGFHPRYSAVEAIQHYVESKRLQAFQDPRELRPYANERLSEIMAERRRARSGKGRDRGPA